MEKRTETGLVMGHAYGVTAVKKVCMSLGLKHFLVKTMLRLRLKTFSHSQNALRTPRGR